MRINNKRDGSPCLGDSTARRKYGRDTNGHRFEQLTVGPFNILSNDCSRCIAHLKAEQWGRYFVITTRTTLGPSTENRIHTGFQKQVNLKSPLNRALGAHHWRTSKCKSSGLARVWLRNGEDNFTPPWIIARLPADEVFCGLLFLNRRTSSRQRYFSVTRGRTRIWLHELPMHCKPTALSAAFQSRIGIVHF